ncbi:hypothetical protein N9466_06380 [Amylibacter sp.]|nr:hypothetical protein [Amylibacter sp.]
MKYKLERTNANDDEATLIEIHFKNGQKVDQGSLLMVFETSKAAIEIEAYESGPVYTNFKVGSIIKINEIVAYQNEQPKQYNDFTKDNSVVFSEKALEIIKKKKIDKNLFSNMKFVTEKDVLNKIDAPALESSQKHSPLEGYLEPPVAYFTFKIQNTEGLKILFDLIKNHFLKLINKKSVHVLVNHNDKLVPYRMELDQVDPKKILGKAFMEVYRGKKSSEQVMLCLSHLTANFDFSHSALLYPGSLITIASAENTKTGEIVVNITYDHRYMNGFSILKAVEKIA